MIDSWQIYWVTRLDHIHGMLAGFTTVTVLLCFALLFIGCVAVVCVADDKTITNKRRIYWKIVTGMVAAILLPSAIIFTGAFIPHTKEAILIVGLPMLLQNQKAAIETMGRIPNKTLQIFESYLDEELGKRKEEAVKDVKKAVNDDE